MPLRKRRTVEVKKIEIVLTAYRPMVYILFMSAKQFKKLRTDKGYTQAELAAILKVTISVGRMVIDRSLTSQSSP